MCTPLAAGAALLSVAGGISEMSGMQQANRMQEEENNKWLAYQRKIRTDEDVRQEDARRKAEASRETTAETFTPANQQTQQATGEQNLANQWVTPQSADMAGSAANNLLVGSGGGDQATKADLASRVATATADARKRIAALARVQSYGGGMQGLGTYNAGNLAQGATDIGLQGRVRQGSLSTYGVERQVEPGRVSYTPGIGGILGKIGGALGGIA